MNKKSILGGSNGLTKNRGPVLFLYEEISRRKFGSNRCQRISGRQPLIAPTRRLDPRRQVGPGVGRNVEHRLMVTAG